ncbi:MAG: heparinase II/III family protein [Terricaulis sp.]
MARTPGEARAFQFATHSAFQRLEAKELRILFDVGGAPPPAFSERAHAGALAFEMSSGRERLIVNVGAARELEPAGRSAARATNAHSTLVVADALSATLDEQRRGKGPARLSGPTLDDVRRSSDESGITAQGRHDGYRAQFGLLHRRYLFIDHAGRNLRGIDELMRPVKMKGAAAKQPIPFVARFHLHPSVRATLIEHKWRCSRRRAVSVGASAPMRPISTSTSRSIGPARSCRRTPRKSCSPARRTRSAMASRRQTASAGRWRGRIEARHAR